MSKKKEDLEKKARKAAAVPMLRGAKMAVAAKVGCGNRSMLDLMKYCTPNPITKHSQSLCQS